jgi:hypothetical protein
MKKVLLVAVLAAFASATAVFAEEQAEKKANTIEPLIYACDKCQKTAVKAATCCEKAMVGLCVVAIKDGKAICCQCSGDCKCTLKEGDETKCKCDKDVKKVDLKGMCVCEKCKIISDKEGKCTVCDGDLKAVKSEEKAAPAAAPAE